MERAVEATRRLEELRVSPYDLPGHARVLNAMLELHIATIEIIVAQDERIAKLEERIGETIGMGG